MDKQRVIQIADGECSEALYQFSEADIMKFAAAILLEAAKVCGERSKEFAEERDEEGFSRFGECIGAYACKYKPDQIAKELTQ